MAAKKKRVTANPDRRATLEGQKTATRVKREKQVDESRRLRAQRARFDVEATGAPAEGEDAFRAGLVDLSGDFEGPDLPSSLATGLDIGEDIDVSDPDYLSSQFSDEPAQVMADFAANDKSLGGFLPGVNVSSRVAQKDMPPLRAGVQMGKILRAESAGRAAETPRIKSTGVKAARQTQIRRAASNDKADRSVGVSSADRPYGFDEPKPYSVGSVEKSMGATEEGVRTRLISEVKDPEYMERTQRMPLTRGAHKDPSVVGPRPSARGVSEIIGWNPSRSRSMRGQRITFPTSEEASQAAQVTSALGAMFGQAPATPEQTERAVAETTRQVQRNVPLKTQEGIRITPNPDDPREPYILDPMTDEGALREFTARKQRGGKVSVTYARAPKTARKVAGSATRAVNPAADFLPRNQGILQRNLEEYKEAGFSGTEKELVTTMGIDEATSKIAEREVSEAPLGVNVYDELRPTALGGPRIGGTQQPDIELQNEGTGGVVPYEYGRFVGEGSSRRKVRSRNDPGRSMPTPTLRGIEELRQRSPRSAEGLEAGMYKGQVGAGDTIKWERGEVPVWRRGTETAPGTTRRALPAPAAPAAPDQPLKTSDRDQRVIQDTARNAQSALYKSPAGVAARQAMTGDQFIQTYRQAAAAFAQPPKAQPPVTQGRGAGAPLQYREGSGQMEELRAPATSDFETRTRRQGLADYEKRGGLIGLYERAQRPLPIPKSWNK